MTKRQPRPDRRFRRLLPTVLSSAALAAASLPSIGHAATGPPHLTLRPTATGYALVSESGRVAYSADGARARERCLRRALQLGVVRLR